MAGINLSNFNDPLGTKSMKTLEFVLSLLAAVATSGPVLAQASDLAFDHFKSICVNTHARPAEIQTAAMSAGFKPASHAPAYMTAKPAYMTGKLVLLEKAYGDGWEFVSFDHGDDEPDKSGRAVEWRRCGVALPVQDDAILASVETWMSMPAYYRDNHSGHARVFKFMDRSSGRVPVASPASVTEEPKPDSDDLVTVLVEVMPGANRQTTMAYIVDQLAR